MYVADLTDPADRPWGGRFPRPTAILELGVAEPVTLSPSLPRMQRIALDLAVKPADGLVGLLVPAEGLVRAGLTPLLPVELISPAESGQRLGLLVASPLAEVTLEPGTVLARLLVLDVANRRIYNSAELAHEILDGEDAERA